MTAGDEQPTDFGVKPGGHGQKVTRKMEQLIANLLTEPTYALAAEKTGISEPTLYRWLRLPAFQRAYRDARRRVVDVAVSRLCGLTEKAVAALEKNLKCGVPGAEIRAAVAVLDNVKALLLGEQFEEQVAKMAGEISELQRQRFGDGRNGHRGTFGRNGRRRTGARN
jgi:hypothetical protein